VNWFGLDYASTVCQTGDTQSALEMHLKILKKGESTSGEHNETTLQSYYVVGSAYSEIGRLDEAG
jgi:hypothetical protein